MADHGNITNLLFIPLFTERYALAFTLVRMLLWDTDVLGWIELGAGSLDRSGRTAYDMA